MFFPLNNVCASLLITLMYEACQVCHTVVLIVFCTAVKMSVVWAGVFMLVFWALVALVCFNRRSNSKCKGMITDKCLV